MQQSSVRMVGSAEFRTYAYLFNTARSLFLSAKEHRSGSNYCRVSAVLFSAFAVEACLNHIGEEKLPWWDIVEPKLQWENKLQLITQYFSVEIDKGKRPSQTIYKLFKFRNKLAHGKTETVNGSYIDACDCGDQLEVMDPTWLKEWHSNEVIERVLEDTQKFIELLLEKAGFPQKNMDINCDWHVL